MIRRMKIAKEVKEIKIVGFPEDDRTWRIDWYDKVSRNPDVSSDPKIKVMISPVNNKTNSIFNDYTTNWSQSKIITLSISYLNRISIGSTWMNGKLVGLPNRKKDRVYAFKISIPPQNPEPIFYTLGEEIKDIKWNYMQFYKTNCLVFENCPIVFMNKRIVLNKVIIPCTEVLRFYFATSTKLVRKIIYHSGNSLMKELVLFIDSEGNIRTDPCSSPMLLTLKTRIPDGDCWSIARLLTDKTATREANRLYRNFASKNLMYNKEKYIIMGFPFSGASQLNAFGKLSEDGQSLLVLNIAFCNADFNFTELDLDRENSNLVKNKKELVREVGFSYSKKYNLDELSEFLLSNHSEPTKNISRQTIKDIKEEPRFLKTKDIKLRKLIKENRKYRSASSIQSPSIIASTYGTGDGSYSGDASHFPIDITEEHEDMENIELSGVKKPSSNKNDARPYFKELIQIMHELEKMHSPSKFSWNAIKLPEGTRHKELILSTFPDPIPNYGTGSQWLNISKDRRRTLLWLEVRRENNYTYIAELDCRPTERKGIYILKYHRSNKASNDELRKIMQLWASNNIYCTKYGLKQHGKMPWDRTTIHHKDPQKLIDAIWRAL